MTEAPRSGYTVPDDGRVQPRGLIRAAIALWVAAACLVIEAAVQAFFPFDAGETYDGEVHFNPGAALVVLNQAAIIVALVVADYPLRSESVRLYFDPQRPIP